MAKEWICTVCGYVAEGEEEDRAASGEEALSDDELRDEINGQQRIF